MPNFCDFTMRVKGEEANIAELYDVLNNNYEVGKEDNPLHMYRIFEAFGCNYETNDDGETIATISGYCAWSVHCCMFEGSTTYYADWVDKDVNATSITQLSKNLNLVIEIFSEEPGMCFSEHYVIANGEVELDETVDLMILSTTEFDYEYFKDSDYEDEISDAENEEYIKAKREYIFKQYGDVYANFINSIDDYDFSRTEEFYVSDNCDFLGNFNFTLF